MVFILIGAVTIGVVSICAIPFAVLMSRKPAPRARVSGVSGVRNPRVIQGNSKVASPPNNRNQSSVVKIKILVVDPEVTGAADSAETGFATIGNTNQVGRLPIVKSKIRRCASDSRITTVGEIPNFVRYPALIESAAGNAQSDPMIASFNSGIFVIPRLLRLSVSNPEAVAGPSKLSETSKPEITLSGSMFGEFKEDVKNSSTPTLRRRYSSCKWISDSSYKSDDSTASSFWVIGPLHVEPKEDLVETIVEIKLEDTIDDEPKLFTINEGTSENELSIQELSIQETPAYEGTSKHDGEPRICGIAGRIWRSHKEYTRTSSL